MGLCLPRRIFATSEASRPSTAPSASTTYQRRSMSRGLGANVLVVVINCCPGLVRFGHETSAGGRPTHESTRGAGGASKVARTGALGTRSAGRPVIASPAAVDDTGEGEPARWGDRTGARTLPGGDDLGDRAPGDPAVPHRHDGPHQGADHLMAEGVRPNRELQPG